MWIRIWISVFLASIVSRALASCPPVVCSCSNQDNSADCANRGLLKTPLSLPPTLKSLDLSGNVLDLVDTTEIQAMSELQFLDLSSNRLSGFSFSGTHYKLRKLDLSSNNITTVRSLQIDALIHLAELNLANNKIISLPSTAFPSGAFLRTLNLKNNQIVALDEKCMDSLTSLETLILSRNNLSSLPKGLFKNLTSLQTLELNKNKFVEVQSLVFHGLDNLKVLRLKRNQIEYLGTGAFHGLNHITELSLDKNKLKEINLDWLYGLHTLTYLSLAHNNIDYIHDDSWKHCTSLDELDLRSNQLQVLHPLDLSHLPNLTHLYLHDNKISQIEDKTFSQTVPQLETLALDGNQLSHTIENMEAPFNISKLKTLSLSHNAFNSIGNKAFVGLNSVEVIDIRDNVISTVQENAFKHLPRLRSILMNSASMLCDCYLKWLPKWMNETLSLNQGQVMATCAHPEKLKGQYITFVPYDSYTCDDFPKPYILKQPETQVTLRGENLTLTCRAASTSPADLSFSWKIDSHLVEVTNNGGTDEDCTDRCIRYHPHSFDGKGREVTAKLILTNLTDDDSGRYQCIVSNKFGTTYSERADITVYVYPTFVVTPEDVVVEAGSSAPMKCVAQGVPAPQVNWTKDFGSPFPAAEERRLFLDPIIPEDDRLKSVNSIIIQNVKGRDMGTYTCKAKNPAGTISWNITLTVLEIPRFVKPMEDKVVEEGDTAVIECKASGSPTPEFTWYKDEEKLEPTERHFFAADNQLLAVVNARLTDSGLYKCVVNNPLGTETQSSMLTVSPFNHFVTTPHPDGDAAPFNNEMLIIIIVAFVCGAVVLASFIWLIVCICRHKSCLTETSDSRRHAASRRCSDGRIPFNYAKNEGLPLASDYQGRQPRVVANQYTTSHHQHHRKSSLQNHGEGKGTEEYHRKGSSIDEADATEQPLLDQVAAFEASEALAADEDAAIMNPIHHDNSSEKDSGTGDSQCISRDHLDVLTPEVAKDGGGESTMSLTEFEATDLTRLDSHTDIDEEDNVGCGEAILSASNSILTNLSRNSFEASAGEINGSPPTVSLKPVSGHLRTFKPHRSLSRDFLNCDSSPSALPDDSSSRMKRTSRMKKQASALELNNHDDDPHHVYRGGAKPQSGLEFNEKLLEHSLNSTDYSLQSRYSRTQRNNSRVVGGAGGHSLPRSKGSKNKHKSSSQFQTQSPHELYTTVPLKDDKLF